MTISPPPHSASPSSSKQGSGLSDTKTVQPISSQHPISPTFARLRSQPSGPTRPPTPIPLRPGAPPSLRVHPKLPSLPLQMPKPSSSAPPLRRSLKSSSPVSSMVKTTPTTSASKNTIKLKRSPKPLTAACDSDTVKSLNRPTIQQAHPLSPVSPEIPRAALSIRNGSISEDHTVEQLHCTDDATSLILPSLDGEDKENRNSQIVLSATPSSSVFPPSMSEVASIDSMKPPSAKSVRWAEISVFPEQQGLVNIHGLLKTLVGESKGEIKDLCVLLRDYLPQPGLLSERRYTLRSAQEEELEHALRVLDGALYRNLDPAAVEKAMRTLRQLAPILQLRFATLPFHREVGRLKAERLHLKEERALVLVQLAIQESEIKSAQLRREAERNREIEEAAMRRMKRREEKIREKQVYFGFRKLLEETSGELVELNRRIAAENERLLAVRQEREEKNARKQKATLPLGTGPGRSVTMTSVRRRDGIKCWI